MTKKRNPHLGSSLDDFLKEEGTFEELQVQAIKEVNRLLDPESDITLSSLQRAAALVGRKVRLELV
jgi:antitoxin HicB